MKHKIGALLLCICMICIGAMPSLAAKEVEFLQNGNFTAKNENDLPRNWTFKNGTFLDGNFTLEKCDDGTGAIHMVGENVYIKQDVKGVFVAGEKYKLTGMLTVRSVIGRGAGTKLEFYKADGTYLSAESEQTHNYYTRRGIDKPYSYEFTMPESVSTIVVYVRVYDRGDVTWSHLSLKGEGSPGFTEKPAETANPNAIPMRSLVKEEVKFVKNGDFNAVNDSGNPSSWAQAGVDSPEESIKIDTSNGTNAIHLKGENVYIKQQLSGALVPGGKYELTARVKLISYTGKGAGTKLEFFTPEGSAISGASDNSHNYYTKVGDWADYKYTFTAPENVGKIILYVRMYDTGEVLWDDVQIVGPGRVSVVDLDALVPQEPWEDVPNLLPGGDFENATDKIEGWNAPNWSYFSFPTDPERGGKVLKITNTDSTQNPYVRYFIPDIMPGTTYQVTGWLKTESYADDGPGFKAEFYADSVDNPGQGILGGYCAEQTGPKFGPTDGKWKRISATFTTPDQGAYYLSMMIRIYGAGVIYYDDLECRPVGKRTHANVLNECFIYSEWTHNDVDITVYNSKIQTVECSILDGETVLDTKVLPASRSLTYTYETALLKEKGKEYTLKVAYKDADGQDVTEPYTEDIYRYDRPKYLTDDGYFIGADGVLVNPVIGYHVFKDDLANCAAAGINVVQSENWQDKATAKNLDYLIAFMDDAWYNYGIRTAAVLYADSQSAGYATNFDNTVKCVETIKDHPGLFCYMLQDEPFLPSRLKTKTVEDTVAELKKASKAIRDLDDKHPIYICEQSRSSAFLSERMVDVLVGDPYVQSNPMDTFVYGIINSFKDTARNQKPVYAILQAWKYNGWEPGANDIRHMVYQTLFARAEGVGYYDFSKFDTAQPLWGRMCYPGVTMLAEGELEDAFKAFVTGEYPTFNEESGDTKANYWYKAYVKNNELYYVLMNLRKTQTEVNIPMTSFDNSITIGTYKGVGKDTDATVEISGNGEIKMTLEPHQTLYMKITPDTPVDFSTLTTSKFYDLTTHSWAKAQIDNLANLGLVTGVSERKFAPGEKITRADFAVFLVRTLGLTADTSENFSDVAPFATCAKELAIGKALGILQGVGDNKFNPYAEITRQDLMAICARGMRLVKELNANGGAPAFSDSTSIADYAATDVGAMTEAGIVKGYEDGTVKPLENTTRAEAAVIMDRILTWKNAA